MIIPGPESAEFWNMREEILEALKTTQDLEENMSPWIRFLVDKIEALEPRELTEEKE